uniref:Uncharacterized protein n=1 Tax=Arundo donax TaxID=35708 RepID=A0A0A8XX93_ARUDO
MQLAPLVISSLCNEMT